MSSANQAVMDRNTVGSYLNSHLTLTKPENGTQIDADTDRREAYCKSCNYRVTVTRDGVELGHKRSCDHHCYGGDYSA